LKIGVAHGVR